ncbi:hypothetical protein MJI95_35075, partial [Salmonella enterica subsp. enterica serovar Kentucky]|nr:hypothetical protein [Salmonella enterica subsp. enterica serovar Kentucky]
VGGITSQGVAFGANVNTRAILDMTSQFDFYHGGGLDVCYLSFAFFFSSLSIPPLLAVLLTRAKKAVCGFCFILFTLLFGYGFYHN